MSSSRRQFLGISARTAGKVAATGLVSLPVLASMSKKANALGWMGWSEGSHHPGPNGGGGGRGHCFLRGTLIQTPDGEIPIEQLKVGTVVDTLRGPMPVKWIGRQKFEKTTTSWHWSIAPIRIKRFALSDQYPRRDLILSPHHSLFIDGLLMPVQWLVNGSTITFADTDNREAIEYFHIEMETHEVVFAEGAPAETLLVECGREQFGNFIEYEKLYGANGERVMLPFAPRIEYDGPAGDLSRILRSVVRPIVDIRDPVQKARARIAARSELILS
jgi:Hint domain-containing protein